MALTAAKTLTGGTSSEGRVSGYVFKLVRESLGVTQQGLAEHLSVGVAPSSSPTKPSPRTPSAG